MKSRNLIVIYFISVVAIISNIYIFSTVTLLIIGALNAEENLGIPFLPLALFVNSFSLFSLLGFFNLNQITKSKLLLGGATLVGTLIMLLALWVLPINHYLVVTISFGLIMGLAIRYLKNLNLIPSIINAIIIGLGVIVFIMF